VEGFRTESTTSEAQIVLMQDYLMTY